MSDGTTWARPGGATATAEEVLQLVLRRAPVRVFEVDANAVFVMNEGINPPGGSAPGSLVGISARKAYANFPEGLVALGRALAGTEREVGFSQEGKTYG